MPPENDSADPVTRLRWLAASDPKRARALFHTLLNGHREALDLVLRSASRPGDGRLRQVIATVFRTEPAATVLEPWLRNWFNVEPDEFTKGAIAAALAVHAPLAGPRSQPHSPSENPVEAYRYVADRLCHRIRNALTLPSAQMVRLEQLASETDDPDLRAELLAIHAGTQAGLLRISRNVEFDTGDDYLAWQSVQIVPWLNKSAQRFAAHFGPASFNVTCDQTVRRAAVRASHFLLDTTFGNIWANSVQATDSPCSIDVQCAVSTQRAVIEMLVIDSGPGFPEAQLETAFQQVFSTKAPSRGRGLLEIADAMTRLQGTFNLAKDDAGRYRLLLALPLEVP